MLNEFNTLILAAKSKIEEGYDYNWSHNLQLRGLSLRDVDKDVSCTFIYKPETQDVVEAQLWLQEHSDKPVVFRWISTSYRQEYDGEYFKRNLDPRNAFSLKENDFGGFTSDEDCVYFIDCELFEDFKSKVEQAFETGSCTRFISLDLNLEQELLDKAKEMSEKQGIPLESWLVCALSATLENEKEQTSSKWGEFLNSLTRLGFNVEFKFDCSITRADKLQEIENWLKEQESLKGVALKMGHKTKLTSKGLLRLFYLENQDGQVLGKLIVNP